MLCGPPCKVGIANCIAYCMNMINSIAMDDDRMLKMLQYVEVRSFFWAKDADPLYLHTSCLTQTHLQNVSSKEANLLEGSSSYRTRGWSLAISVLLISD